jgi:predicted protein tyrosine phosphatase
MSIIVCPLRDVETVVRMRRPSHVITLLDPGDRNPAPKGIPPERHLRLGVHDISETAEGMIAPEQALVAELMAFGRTWTGDAPLLIHCWAGISRSTASAFALACERNPHVEERTIALELRRVSRTAFPNRRIVALADDWLNRRGRMVDAVNAMSASFPASCGEPFELRIG